MAKKFKNLKTSFRHYFLPKRDEIGRDGEKKNFFRIPSILDSGEKILKKIAKKLKKLRNISPILFLAKTG